MSLMDFSVLRDFVMRLKRWLVRAGGPDSPEDPYSYVGARKKPRLPHLSASAKAPLE
jgi:hypothetical protein